MKVALREEIGASLIVFAVMTGFSAAAGAAETVELAFIGPLAGSNSAHGLGGATRQNWPSSCATPTRVPNTSSS